MKTSKMFMAIAAIVAMASCNNDKDFVNQPDYPETAEAYASFSISIPHASGIRSISDRATDPGTSLENNVKSLHIFIYDKESPFTPTVTKFTVDDNTLKQASDNSSQWVTTQPISTKKSDKYIFAGVNQIGRAHV